ncbi:tRNA (guanosine(37)-N1)-methyltransferase TrmD [Butyrivibrio sp. AE3004]|uniref:tRNA (guanosine(37)-N1)-methyltransferase TrmD n=1 Tax=Butyrivibrio sp. AE3004 TaxID=1506994 RepID=UPI0004945EDD|nr:tRNA (guanosine(37)-N1)-methyltransferase TrmD [Butyrivibrio sp. AE3004]
MHFYVMTLFPDMVLSGLRTSILARGMDKELIHVEAYNIRDYADNKHNKVDDYTYGGGAGMLMQAQPIYSCYQAILKVIKEREPDANPRVVYVTPQGSVFSQGMARDFAKDDNIIFLCGHYEGIDERVLEEIVTDYVSIGDYVLTGGELPAMVMIDAVARLVPGVLNNEESAETESFDDGLLEYPQYSRPEVWMEKRVPPVLLSGNHQNVDVWRFQKSLERTKERRPELYDKYVEEHPEQFTPKAIKKRNRILDKIED